ncbi:MAG: helix-turn-helix domain-containing protein [Hyphomicrobiales bacterium]
MFALDVRDPTDRASFAFDSTSYSFGNLSVSSSTSSPSEFNRSPQVIARSGIDHLLVQTYLGGGYFLEADGREVEVKTGDVCIVDFTRTSRLQTTSFSQLSVVFPRSVMESLIPDVDVLHGLVLPRGTPLNTILVSHLRTLLAQAPGLSLEEGRAAARGTAALIAAFAGPSTDGRDAAAQALAMASLRTLRRVVEANLDNPELGPNFLMRHGGVSRATLYRLFEPLGGVRNYIQQRRLMHAFQTICDTAMHKERIGVIARRCGFTGDAVFSRAFRNAYGMSPSEVRDTAKLGYLDAQDSEHRSGGSFWELNRWLLGLDTSAMTSPAQQRRLKQPGEAAFDGVVGDAVAELT